MMSPIFDIAGKSVWVAGHRGMVGSAVVRRLADEGISDLLVATSNEVDLRRQDATEEFVMRVRPDVAIIAAAKVGGIHANRSAQADFLYDNIMIATNCLRACQIAGVEKIIVLGSSCIYPGQSPQPIREEYLLTGPLEPTNEGYAVAKIAAVEYGRMLRMQYGMDVVSMLPTNLYGPGDNYDPETSHVLPALIRKIHKAKMGDDKTITLWGSGKPRREFLHVDDLADAVLFVMEHYSGETHLNVGTGRDIPILELAQLIGNVVGWSGKFLHDTSMPNGVMQKLLDVSRLTALGWTSKTELREGVRMTYSAFLVERAADPARQT